TIAVVPAQNSPGEDSFLLLIRETHRISRWPGRPRNPPENSGPYATADLPTVHRLFDTFSVIPTEETELRLISREKSMSQWQDSASGSHRIPAEKKGQTDDIRQSVSFAKESLPHSSGLLP